MKRVIKIGFPILCVAVIGGTFILLNKTTERISRNNLKEKEEYQNTVEERLLNETVENESTNEVHNTVIVDQEAARIQEVKNKAKAIEIVKQLAPPTSNCYYTNEGMTGNNYLVAIRENDTKNVKIYYSVDIVNEKIQIYVK